jgi:hypothetical protein
MGSSWSKKYNLLFDRLLSSTCFDKRSIDQDLRFWLGHRTATVCRSIRALRIPRPYWLVWCAALSDDPSQVRRLIAPPGASP